MLFDTDALSLKKPEEIFLELGTSGKGLSEAEAQKRLSVYGKNELNGQKKMRPVLMFFSKFKNPILITLLLAATISYFLGSIYSSAVILVMVLLSASVDFFNAYKSEQAMEMLKAQISVTSNVTRNGISKERNVHEIVPGDILTLTAGDVVPADCCVIEAKDFFVNESVLTGESLPVEKSGDKTPAEKKILMGTSVISGWCLAIAVSTGLSTKYGQIAHKLDNADTPSAFDRELKDFSIFIFRTTFFLVLAVLLLSVFLKQNPIFEIFLFAVAIAVGLAPELLPMIITTNLAKGANKMSHHGVIVRRLSSIHNFGSIDILCTDKTGTLTEDKIGLVKYLDGQGNSSEEVLYWGYVSSYFNTALRGAMGAAVLEHGGADASGCEKVDEFPFDYERRRDAVVVSVKSRKNGENMWAGAGEEVLLSKGAPEEIFKISSFFQNEKQKLTPELLEAIKKEYDLLSLDGYRVLAIAGRKLPAGEKYSTADEKDMVFLGLLCFLDPPKKTVKEALRRMEEFHVEIKIITGDNHLVTERIAKELNLPVKGILTGEEMARMSESELIGKAEGITIFSRVNPEQKEQVIKALRARGHTVGYMGDGANDLLSLKAADVSISVNNAVDIAKQTADIILLRKGLGEIIEGIIEGRKTFANIFKYLMMALSSNFGNMASMPIASLFFNFLPMTAPQILFNNFLYDMSQLTIPFDRVDAEFLKKPKKFQVSFLKKFMIVFGPISSIFDLLSFFVFYKVFQYSGMPFQTGWFLESIASQTLVVNIIRTRGFSLKSKPSLALIFGSVGITAIAWLLSYSPLAGELFGFARLPLIVLGTIAGIVAVYLVVVEAAKHWFYKKWGYLIEA